MLHYLDAGEVEILPLALEEGLYLSIISHALVILKVLGCFWCDTHFFRKMVSERIKAYFPKGDDAKKGRDEGDDDVIFH